MNVAVTPLHNAIMLAVVKLFIKNKKGIRFVTVHGDKVVYKVSIKV